MTAYFSRSLTSFLLTAENPAAVGFPFSAAQSHADTLFRFWAFPPDVALLLSYIRGLFVTVCFYWSCSFRKGTFLEKGSLSRSFSKNISGDGKGKWASRRCFRMNGGETSDGFGLYRAGTRRRGEVRALNRVSTYVFRFFCRRVSYARTKFAVVLYGLFCVHFALRRVVRFRDCQL